MELKIGDDVVTEHGAGFVVGWEAFDGKGFSLPVSKVDTGRRVVIKLLVGHTWPFEGLYYTQAHELKIPS